MKKDYYAEPKSSFLALAKDTSLIMKKLLSNQNLLKLLYYTDSDWKNKPDLKATEIKSLFENKQISNIPRLAVDKTKMNYLRLTYDSFSPNGSNPYYRDHILEVRIICHFEDWDLENYELRPYRIAGEIDSMLDQQHFTGIGVTNFLSAETDIYDNEFGGLTLRYWIVNGNEDKVNPLT